MIMEDKTPAPPRWVRKLLIPVLFGALVGYAAATGALHFIDGPVVGGLGKSETVAALVGVIYAVIGLGLALGTANPGVGARYLNVEDADELREQKTVLTLSGAAMAIWGASLFVLALAAPVGPVPQAVALAAGAGGLVVGAVIAITVHRNCDELMRAMNLEAGSLTYGLIVLVGGGWAMLAHLGYIAAPAPLDWLTLFFVLVLVASFTAVGRRGMLMPR